MCRALFDFLWFTAASKDVNGIPRKKRTTSVIIGTLSSCFVVTYMRCIGMWKCSACQKVRGESQRKSQRITKWMLLRTTWQLCEKKKRNIFLSLGLA
jgi:hypothetical protein